MSSNFDSIFIIGKDNGKILVEFWNHNEFNYCNVNMIATRNHVSPAAAEK